MLNNRAQQQASRCAICTDLACSHAKEPTHVLSHRDSEILNHFQPFVGIRQTRRTRPCPAEALITHARPRACTAVRCVGCGRWEVHPPQECHMLLLVSAQVLVEIAGAPCLPLHLPLPSKYKQPIACTQAPDWLLKVLLHLITMRNSVCLCHKAHVHGYRSYHPRANGLSTCLTTGLRSALGSYLLAVHTLPHESRLFLMHSMLYAALV